MFRLLAVLLAVHLSTKVDGSPVGQTDSSSFVLPQENYESQALALAKKQAPVRLEAARVLLSNDEVDPLNDKNAASIIDAAVSTYCLAYNRHLPITAEMDDAALLSVKLAELAKIFKQQRHRRESNIANELSGFYRRESNAKRERPPSDTSVEFYKAQAAATRKEFLPERVEAARVVLSDPDVDPLNNKKAGWIIDAAVITYCDVYNLHLPITAEMDDAARMSVKLAVLANILKTYGHRQESNLATELSGFCRRESNAKKERLPYDTPVEFYEAQAKAAVKEMALTHLDSVKELLSNPNANPLKDRKLAREVDAAFTSYHSAYNVPLPDLENLNEEGQMAVKVETLRRIFKNMDIGTERRKASKTITTKL